MTLDNISNHPATNSTLNNFLRVNAQMHNLDLAKNGARPQTVMRHAWATVQLRTFLHKTN